MPDVWDGPVCTICGKQSTEQDIDGSWWPACEHPKMFGLNVLRYSDQAPPAAPPVTGMATMQDDIAEITALRSALAAERAAGAALPDFRDAYRSEVDKALAKGLRQEVAHELGLFATYLVGKAAGRAARALAANREEPYPDDPGQTHYDGCWRVRGHHNCAVAEVTALRSALAAERAAGAEAESIVRRVVAWDDAYQMGIATNSVADIIDDARKHIAARALAADREHPTATEGT